MAALCVVVLNYCTPDATIACLETLYAAAESPRFKRKGHTLGVWVCDNGSDDDSVHRISQWAEQHINQNSRTFIDDKDLKPSSLAHCTPEQFIFVRNAKNVGYAKGNNTCLRPAFASNMFDYFLIANSDIEFNKESPAQLLEDASNNPHVGIWGCTVVFADFPDIVQCAGGWLYNPLSTTVRPVMGGSKYDEIYQPSDFKMDYVYGACLMVAPSVFAKCGFLNENLFLYFEELDFCLKARKQGIKMGWSNKSVVKHRHAHSASKLENGTREYHEMCGVLTITKNHYWYFLPIALLIRLFAKTTLYLLRRQPELTIPLFQASYDFIMGRHCGSTHTENK